MAADTQSGLLDLAHETVAAVAHRVSNGNCSFHCQLLASRFYEAAKHELHQTSQGDAQRVEVLSAVLERCHRAAHPRAAPAMILAQLRAALALMQSQPMPITVSERGFPRARPTLRVIQGGLSLVGNLVQRRAS